MSKHNQYGLISTAAVLSVVFALLFFVAMSFGVWAFMERSDYKNNVDEKIAAAVAVAEEKKSTEKDNEFLEREKQPTRLFRGSDTFGGISFQFPKTWSVYSLEGNTTTPVDVTMHPSLVPGGNDAVAYALRLQVVNSNFDKTLKSFESAITKGTLTTTAFAPKGVPDALGVRLSGAVEKDKSGVMILLPLRDKTIKIWTESPSFVTDLDTFVLETLTFQP